MKQKQANVSTNAAVRREELAQALQQYLESGKHIEMVPDGVSGQHPQGKAKPLRPAAKPTATQAEAADSSDASTATSTAAESNTAATEEAAQAKPEA